MISLGWRAWQDISPDLCLLWALLLIGGCAACHTLSVPGAIPPCPPPSHAMVVEARAGALDDAPGTVDYLGRLENFCDGLEDMDE